MLDPVNNRGYYEYSKINTQTGMQTDSGEKFSLEYEKKEDDIKSQEEKNDSEKNGVVVELSGKSNSQLKNYSSATNPYNTFEEEID